jgi:hypothetical protein
MVLIILGCLLARQIPALQTAPALSFASDRVLVDHAFNAP